MSEIRKELRESDDRDIVEGYIAFYEIQRQYDEIKNRTKVSDQEVEQVLTLLESEIERRNQDFDLENSKEFLDNQKDQLKYNPAKRTKWLITRGLDNKKEDEDFIDYWNVYTNFLETFRNPKTDLTQYN